jgi:hypothetical protein
MWLCVYMNSNADVPLGAFMRSLYGARQRNNVRSRVGGATLMHAAACVSVSLYVCVCVSCVKVHTCAII